MEMVKADCEMIREEAAGGRVELQTAGKMSQILEYAPYLILETEGFCDCNILYSLKFPHFQMFLSTNLEICLQNLALFSSMMFFLR